MLSLSIYRIQYFYCSLSHALSTVTHSLCRPHNFCADSFGQTTHVFRFNSPTFADVSTHLSLTLNLKKKDPLRITTHSGVTLPWQLPKW